MLRFLLFLVLNFGALFIGSLLMGSPAENTWYQKLCRAPWTPPGWVFGAAWFTIMVLFAVYLSRVFKQVADKRSFWLLAIAHYVLNVCWNPLFFQWHWVLPALIVLIALFAVLLVYWIRYRQEAGWYRYLLVPYLLWLLIACSLNAYVL